MLRARAPDASHADTPERDVDHACLHGSACRVATLCPRSLRLGSMVSPYRLRGGMGRVTRTIRFAAPRSPRWEPAFGRHSGDARARISLSPRLRGASYPIHAIAVIVGYRLVEQSGLLLDQYRVLTVRDARDQVRMDAMAAIANHRVGRCHLHWRDRTGAYRPIEAPVVGACRRGESGRGQHVTKT
jgi:hypothetical protein